MNCRHCDHIKEGLLVTTVDVALAVDDQKEDSIAHIQHHVLRSSAICEVSQDMIAYGDLQAV